MAALIDRIARSRYVSLTTFRKSGQPVATPVWIARDGSGVSLIVITSPTTWKAKRIRKDPRIELRPCDIRGRVPVGARTVTGTAEIVDDHAEVERLEQHLLAKYGIQFRILRFVERRFQGESSVIVRITLD